MKLTGIDLFASNGVDHIPFSFKDPTNTNEFQMLDATGLDAEEILPTVYRANGAYGGDGSTKVYFDLTLPKREIVLHIGLNPRWSDNHSYSSLRDQLYRMVAASRSGVTQMKFMNGTDVVAAVSGFMMKVEAPPFSKTQDAKVTIECLDPVLRGLTLVALEEEIFGEGTGPYDVTFSDDLSTFPHGFRFQAIFTEDQEHFFMQDESNEWNFVVTPDSISGFQTGDIFHFSSEYNTKELFVARAGVAHHLIDSVVSGSVWPIIFPGTNSIVTSGGFVFNGVAWLPAYLGV